MKIGFKLAFNPCPSPEGSSDPTNPYKFFSYEPIMTLKVDDWDGKVGARVGIGIGSAFDLPLSAGGLGAFALAAGADFLPGLGLALG